MVKCADPVCQKEATRELHGIAMCEGYYIEALEHSAHLVTVLHPQWLHAQIRASSRRFAGLDRWYQNKPAGGADGG